MVIDLKPETEEILKQEMSNGRFRSVDEIILCGIQTRSATDPTATSKLPKENFAQFLRRSPLFGSGIVIPEREVDPERDISL